MIRSFANSETERFFATGRSRRLPPDILKRAAMRLVQLHAATTLEDLRQPPSNRLEALKGSEEGSNRSGSTINGESAFDSKTAMLSTSRLSTITKGVRNVSASDPLAIHPGEFLAEILEALNLSQAAFARNIGVSPMRISHVINGSRPVTAEMALLFGKALGQSPEYWMNLQSIYDLRTAKAAIGKRLSTIRHVTV